MRSVLVIPEGVEASDGRSYPAGLLTWRETVPLQFSDETTEHHEGAYHVGNITNLRRQTVDGATWIVGDLTYDTDEDASEAERLAQEGKVPGVSADVAVISEVVGIDEEGFPILDLVSAEIVGVTQVPMPAFAGARILTDTEAMDILPPLVAALRPDLASDWFADPKLDGPTPLTVTDEGRIYGHLATWGTCHIGFGGQCVTPPTSSAEYGYFHTGVVSDTPVGHITMGTGHATLTADQHAAVEHYDNTGTCVADIRVGEDEHGIWVAGAARPDADLDALRAASLSGDWRRINGQLELVAALAVNVPGFPIPRTQTAMAAAGQLALVASGIVEPEPEPDPMKVTVRIDDEQMALLNRLEAKVDHLLGDDWDDEPTKGDVPPSTGHLAAVLDRSA